MTTRKHDRLVRDGIVDELRARHPSARWFDDAQGDARSYDNALRVMLTLHTWFSGTQTLTQYVQ